MTNNKVLRKTANPIVVDSGIESSFSTSTVHSLKYSQHLLSYYKQKSIKLEEDFNELLKELENIKTICDHSNELQKELNSRSAEVSELQKVISNLQIHLFREKEQNLKLSSENEVLKMEDYNNKKKINILLMSCGAHEKKFLHLATNFSKPNFVPSKLPPKLQKLKEMKQKELLGIKEGKSGSNGNEDFDPQVLLLNNQLLASQLENHMKVSKEQINVLLKDKEISDEERKIERQRLEKELESMTTKLEKSHELLCVATEKLIKWQQLYEKEKRCWVEEKNKYLETITTLKDNDEDNISDIVAHCTAKAKYNSRNFIGNKPSERDEVVNAFQEKVIELEGEVYRLRERAQICRNAFREKAEKMTAQVMYLKNKYEVLDRRRLLEAEGFRTDIKMLKKRVKELEKKLTKAVNLTQPTEQEQLLISARNALSKAKQLDKELSYMKTKISLLESNEESCF